MTSKPKLWLVARRGSFDVGPDIGADHQRFEANVAKLENLKDVASVEQRPTDLPSWTVKLEADCYENKRLLHKLLQAVLAVFSDCEPLYYINDGSQRRSTESKWKEFIAKPFERG
jgi:hypothetical protein